jgi:putative ABC transport system ATP-binding protein
MTLVKLKQVSKDYALGNTTVAALAQIDLEIKRGEFTAIWGPSGSGKSTLLNILATIDCPSRGQYYFEGQDLSELSDKALTALRQCHIGIIFQHFNLVPVLTAVENIMLPMLVGRWHSNLREVKGKALELAEEVGIADYLHHRPDHLSGGQRQRVAIARALIAQPEFIIADEPTANLDSQTSEKIITLMSELNRKHDTTFLFSTHHHTLIEAARRTIHLLDGRIVDELSATPAVPAMRKREARVC